MVLAGEKVAIKCLECGKEILEEQRTRPSLYCKRKECERERLNKRYRMYRKKEKEKELKDLNELRVSVGRRPLSGEEYEKVKWTKRMP